MTETTATIRISLARLMRRDHGARHAQRARRRDGGEAGALCPSPRGRRGAGRHNRHAAHRRRRRHDG
jgi:hypothetical protein